MWLQFYLYVLAFILLLSWCTFHNHSSNTGVRETCCSFSSVFISMPHAQALRLADIILIKGLVQTSVKPSFWCLHSCFALNLIIIWLIMIPILYNSIIIHMLISVNAYVYCVHRLAYIKPTDISVSTSLYAVTHKVRYIMSPKFYLLECRPSPMLKSAYCLLVFPIAHMSVTFTDIILLHAYHWC